MGRRLHRTQVLLEPAQHATLTAIARRERRSMSEVLRELIDAELARREESRVARIAERLAELERIDQHRHEILAARGGVPIAFDVVGEINAMREERDAEIFGNVFGRADARRRR